jgi:hypothetical protein
MPLSALCLIGLCHAQSVGFGFLAWDDPLHVTQNPLVLTPARAAWFAWMTPNLGYPIPLTIASYAAQAALWGVAQPWPFHALNVLLHLGVCGLSYSVARRMRLSRIAAVSGSLLIGLHPLVAEPVSWVSGRKDLLAALFGLLALRADLPPRTHGWRLRALSWYALGLLSKPSIAALCLLLPAAELAFGDRPRTRREPRLRSAMWSGLFGLLLLAPVVYLGVMGQRAVGAIALGERAGVSYGRALWYALCHHLDLLLLGQAPTAKYVPMPWPPPFSLRFDLLPLLAAAMLSLVLWHLPPRLRRTAGFGALWAFATYLPNSNIIPLARFLADSYLYLPLIGVGWMLGACIDAVSLRLPQLLRRWRVAAPFAIGLALAPLLVISAARFHDDEALWSQARARYPDSARICRQWANGVSTVHGPSSGLSATDRCIARFGSELFVKNRGILLAQTGQLEAARSWLLAAQREHPEDLVVQRYLAGVSGAPANLPKPEPPAAISGP